MDFRLSPPRRSAPSRGLRLLTAEFGTSHDSDPEAMPRIHARPRLRAQARGEGWLALYWPVEYGGPGRPIREQFIDAIARVMVYPALMDAGTKAEVPALPSPRRNHLLPRLFRTVPLPGAQAPVSAGR